MATSKKAPTPPTKRTATDGKGPLKDEVRLELAKEKDILAQNYQVKIAVFTQPAAFGIKISRGDDARELMAKFPPRTPFRLFINDRLQYEGWTDAHEVSVDASNGTSLTIRGRDLLAPIHDGEIIRDRSFENMSAEQLVEEAIKDTGLDATVTLDSTKARSTRSGYKLIAPVNPKITAKQQARLARAYVAESWYRFIKRHLDHSGLFLWAAPNGELVISKPDSEAKATFVIDREAQGEVIEARHTNDTTHRFAETYVYAKGSSIKKTKRGLQDYKGKAVDKEIQALGFTKIKTFRDSAVTNNEEATFFAQRKVAEANRAGWKLSYTVVGHSGYTVDGKRAVWTPDTMVQVTDTHLGISGKFWIESVDFKSPPTTTTLELIRPQDLLFGSDET